jgi:SseB protein C-terminal domain
MTVPDPSPEAPREIHVPGVRFLREQDGSPERLLKSRLLESLKQRAGVQHAYLAQISSGGQSGVALCLKTDHGPDPNLVREIGAIFAAIFGGHEHLDILFLNETQESALRRVCAPFYVVSAPAH